MTGTDRIFIATCIAVTLATFAGLTFFQPAPVINVEPTLVNIDVVELAEAMSYDRDPSTGQLVSWPDNMGIEEEQFLEDCREVCSVPDVGTLMADGTHLPRPRMLYANFDHMVCACFDGDRVNRYVGWQRRR